MGHMTVNQRTQFDRVDLSVPSTGVRVKSNRAPIIFTLVGSAVLGALIYATVVAIDGWAKAVVLGMIMLTTVGMMIAVNPLRRG